MSTSPQETMPESKALSSSARKTSDGNTQVRGEAIQAAFIQESVLKNVLESMPSGLMIVGRGGEVFQVNSTLASMLGFSRETMLQQGWGVLFIDHPDNSGFNDVILDVIQMERVRESREVWYARPDGERFFLKITSSMLRFGEDDWRLVVLVDDMTDLHLMHQREKAALEQKRLAEQQRADSLNNLALSIAHQIRNPIMTIGGFAGLAAKHGDDPDKVTEYLRTVMESAQRLERMASSVREYVSIGPGRPRRLVVLDMLREAARRAGDAITRPGQSLRLSGVISPDWTILADPAQASLALDAVVENGLEAAGRGSRQGTPVTIEARETGEMIEVRVTDSGQGISEQNIPFVRDPFFTTKAVGAGMGLAVAQRVMTLHGGDLKIASSPGTGTQVSLLFPRARD